MDSTNDRILELKNECIARCSNFIHISNKNQGVAKTLNLGIGMAKGDYLFLIASDDVAESHAITTLMNKTGELSNDYAVSCGDSDFIDSNGKKIYLNSRGNITTAPTSKSFSTVVSFHTRWRYDFDYRTSSFGSYPSLLYGNYIPGGLLIKRDAMIEVGGYDENCSLEDWDMWLKLSKRYKMLFIDNTLCHYRIHHSNTSRTQKSLVLREGIWILIREKPYCFSNGFHRLWKKKFANSILAGLQTLSKADLKECFNYISLQDFLIFSAINVTQKRIMRMVCKNRN